MKSELVKTRTRDNVSLHGLLFEPTAPSRLELDAVIVLHGLAGNFYASRLNHDLNSTLTELGLTVLHVNTRGHDEVNLTPRDGRAVNLGAAFEIVDECRWDLAAWADFLVEAGHARLAYLGHSLGAIKSIYAQANQPHSAIQAIVAISASRLSHARFLELPTADKFRDCFETARSLTDQGKGDELIHVDFPFPTHITAQAYVDKYGPADRYNWLRYADQLQTPTLLVFGEKELRENAAFIGIVDDLRELGLPNKLYQLETISGANHFYVGRHAELASTIHEWLLSRFAQ